ncbi:MAG: DNA polymerase III subunit gamma/tau, partial [Planctomycetaceae bacterium]|nr:DNA polymerase III subunit gamma/tau [Planctomycetaceae bacterium]
YIIDEVHMLTKEAFNALLKTLEEPPARVKFIFCTTEPNKVPDTILSRCQRFDFGTIASDSIKGRLASIATAEGVEVADEALDLIARRAAGSMRDSQSLFDQLLAFGGEVITADDVHQLLGTASDDRLIELVNALIERRRDVAVGLLDSSLREGVQISSFSDQLVHYLRDLLIVAVCAEAVELQSVGAAQRGRLAQQAEAWGLQTITAAMQILSETKARMQRVNYDRALLELAVIRLSLLEDLDNIGVTIEKVRGGGAPMKRLVSPARITQVADPAPSTLPTEPTVVSPASSSPSPTKGTQAPQSSHASQGFQFAKKSAVEEPPETPPSVEFSEETLDDFWTKVISGVEDKFRNHLKVASAIAISGPNRLEISIPQSYFLSRQFCDRPESIGQLEAISQELTGQKITITFRTVEAESRATGQRAPSGPAPRPRKRKPKVDQDEFVEQALSIFGAKVVDVREIHEPANEE